MDPRFRLSRRRGHVGVLGATPAKASAAMRAAGLGAAVVNLAISLLAVTDARMIHTAIFSFFALCVVWFAPEIARNIEKEERVVCQVGWALLVFPLVVYAGMVLVRSFI